MNEPVRTGPRVVGIDATLSYLRGKDTGETPRKLDVAALLTIVVDVEREEVRAALTPSRFDILL